MGVAVNLKDRVFGQLTVIERAGTIGKHAAWLCRCECGNIFETRSTLLKNGQSTNCGCVKKANDKIYFTCPWDFDLAFGNDSRIHGNSYKYLHAGNGMRIEKQSHTWYFTLFQRKWFVDMVSKRWNEVAMGMRDAALDEINRIYTDFRLEFLKNYEVWNVLTKKYSTDFIVEYKQDTFDEHVAFLKLYLCKRYDWLDNYFNSNQKYEQLAKGEL